MKRICLFVLLFVACGVFLDSVRQPTSVECRESFTVTLTGTFDWAGAGWLGMMLPDGIRVDSVRYAASDGETALLTESVASLADTLTGRHPCDPDMHWVAFSYERTAAVDSFVSYVAVVYAEATDSALVGDYLLDYRTGYDSDYATETDSILDVPLAVTGLAVAENVLEPAGIGRVWPLVFRDRLSISVPGSEEIGVYDTGGRQVRMLRVEGAGYWDGTSESGRRAPAGAYIVRGRLVCGRVMLVD